MTTINAANVALAKPSAGAAEVMIDVDHLTKFYGAIKAVDDLSFQVGKGEILGFLGPNGAGKTTTMRMLTCYSPPSSGTARLGGFDVRKHSFDVRRILGYLPESAPLYHDMKVRPYLNYMAEVKRYGGSKLRGYVSLALEECGLTGVADRIIGNLSKGYRQRVGLAQALLGEPQVLILDEPTVGLDPAQIQEIRHLIKGMAGRRTVILSTHILPEVSLTCQKVIIINRGRIEAHGTPESLTTNLPGANAVFASIEGTDEAVERALLGADGVLSIKLDGRIGDRIGRWRIDGRAGADPRAAVAAAVVQAGLKLIELRASGLTLEDVFLRVISTQREVA